MSIMIPHINRPILTKIQIPGSKSITNRALLIAALALGESNLENVLFSDDTWALIEALKSLGINLKIDELNFKVKIKGAGGPFPLSHAKIDCHESGTVSRFLLAACANQSGQFLFDGGPRLRQRPFADLVHALSQQGAELSQDHFPLTVKNTQPLKGGEIFISGQISSQFLSGLLMISPYCQSDLTLRTADLVSKPYVDMTCALMREFGVSVSSDEKEWHIKAHQHYQARNYFIESDFSSASYFFAAAAITGGKVTVMNLSRKESIQGDKQFLDVLEKMGCIVEENKQGLTVIGPSFLRGVNVDMRDFSDSMMTLAAIAPFALSPTRISHIANTRLKECDRISAMVYNLGQLGVRVDEEADALTIYPSSPHAGRINPYNDHRIAMAFAIMGLKVEGIIIDQEQCVNKTFPDFFELLKKIEQ